MAELLSEQRKERKEARRNVRADRDGALHQTRLIYEPKIQELKQEWREATREIEQNYQEQLAEIDK